MPSPASFKNLYSLFFSTIFHRGLKQNDMLTDKVLIGKQYTGGVRFTAEEFSLPIAESPMMFCTYGSYSCFFRFLFAPAGQKKIIGKVILP